MAELVGADVEFPVGQSLIFKHHRHRLRRALHLLLEQLVDTLVPWIFPLRPVPFYQDLLSLRRREQRNFRHAQGGIRYDAFQDHAPVIQHPLHAVGLEQVCAVFNRRRPTFGGTFHGQGKIELGCVRGDEPRRGLNSRKLKHHLWKILHCEARLKQRRAARVASHLQKFHESLERHVLVRIRLHGGFLHAAQQLAKGDVVRERGAQDQRVCEEADESFQLHARPAGNGHAHDQIVMPGVAVQQGLERREQNHEQRRALLLRARLQRVSQAGL